MPKLFRCLLVIPLAIIWGTFIYQKESRISPAANFLANADMPYTLVIDAGHGGEDGGAVSVTGAPESQINLAIALKLEDILALYGFAPEMMRREDISLHDNSAETLREKKVSDLHNRVAFLSQLEQPFLISIHQNSYPQPQYYGAQVFYAPTQGSQEFAEHVQKKLIAALAPKNSRSAKQIPDTVYLMNHLSCPAILVECGFLTNPAEEALLRQDTYQRKFAAVLASTVLTWPNETTNDNQESST